MSEVKESLELETRWRRLLQTGSGLFNLADSTHPLRIYVGGNSGGAPTLTVVLEKRPPSIPKFSSLEIEHRKRDDGSWLLLLQLQSMSAYREFVTMCAELIACSKDEADESSSLRAFLVGLNHWRHLFKPVRDDLLTESVLRGLAAELTCMIRLLRPSRSWADVVQGWVGPLDAPQDFRLSDGMCVEVKSVHKDSRSFRVSSLEQLDVVDSRLMLCTVVVERETEEAAGVVTVPELCRQIESHLIGSFDLLDGFRARLKELRFVPDEPAYADFCFRIGGPRIYDVTTEFPRLVRSDVSNDVLRAEYEIALPAIEPFEVEAGSVFPGETEQEMTAWK